MRLRTFALIASLAMGVPFAPAQTTAPAKNGPAEEHSPDGKLLAKGAYKDGLKTGKWTTFNDAGKPADDAVYVNGKLVGTRTFYWPNGKTRATVPYKDGSITGQVYTFDDTGKRLHMLNYPKTLPTIQKAWSELYPYNPLPPAFDVEPLLDPPYRAGVLKKEVTDQALKYLKLYRFLANQPYEQLTVDPALSFQASAVSLVCRHVGGLSHSPAPPEDFPPDVAKAGSEGAAHCNIWAMGPNGATVIRSLRSYMDDSDGDNIGRVGHRAALLDARLAKTGFGVADGYSATYVHAFTSPVQQTERYHVFPGEGYYPMELVEPGYAWSFHYNPAQVAIPDQEKVKVSVQRLGDDWSVAENVPTEVVNIYAERGAPTPVLIFKSKWNTLTPARYAVTIAGIQTKTNETSITYVVDLVSMADVKQAVPATRSAPATRPAAPAAAPPKP